MEGYAANKFVGVDLHLRRSVIVRTTGTGEVLESTRIVNDAERLASVLSRCGETLEVVMEAAYGWYRAADVTFEYRRLKNDEIDAKDLADLLRMVRLQEAWIAPPAMWALRELMRHRAKLVALRSHCKAEIHAVLAKCGVHVSMTDLFGLIGTELLDRVTLPVVYRGRIIKQASRLVRWAAMESVQRMSATHAVGAFRDRIAAKRGRNIAVVAAARKQVGHVYYALREHHVRALRRHGQVARVCGMSRTGSRSALVVQVMTPILARTSR